METIRNRIRWFVVRALRPRRYDVGRRDAVCREGGPVLVHSGRGSARIITKHGLQAMRSSVSANEADAFRRVRLGADADIVMLRSNDKGKEDSLSGRMDGIEKELKGQARCKRRS